MATKSNDPCRDNAKEGEPLFTLRAQDQFAPMLVRLWADMVKMSHKGEGMEDNVKTTLKTDSAFEIANAMEAWQRAHGSKVPD
jgi:hypothetical protein